MIRKRLSLVIFLGLLLFVSACAITPQTEKSDVLVDKDVSYGDHFLMEYDVYYQEGYENAPIVFVVHGGFQPQVDAGEASKEGMRNDALVYAENGFVAVATDYRWTDAPFESKMHDVACSIANFRTQADRYGADADTILLEGYSGGSSASTYLYFRPENDWLEGCSITEPPIVVKGLIMKAGFSLGAQILEEIDEFEYAQGGVDVIVTEEILAIESVAQKIEEAEVGKEPGDLVRVGSINFIDPSDGPVLMIYGEEDVNWEDKADNVDLFQSTLDENGIDYEFFLVPGAEHIFPIGGNPIARKKVLAYANAMANDEPFPF